MTRPSQLTTATKLVFDLGVLAAAYFLAFALRFEGTIPRREFDTFAPSLAPVLLLQYLCLVGCKVPKQSWKYVSLLEVRWIGTALLVANAILAIAVSSADLLQQLLPDSWPGMPPRGVVLLDLLVGGVSLISLRVAVRLWAERLRRKKRGTGKAACVPTLFIGAGSAGAAVVEEIVDHPQLGIQPLGFLDDDPHKRGMVIHGIRVVGGVADLARMVETSGAKQAIITIGDPSREQLRRILDLCKQCGIRTKIIPGIRYILEGKANLSAIREVAIEDLLRREPVKLDVDSIAASVTSRRILITGAGGSIGSELCRIVRRFRPASLMLVEHTENNLFHIHRELIRDSAAGEVIPCMADICDNTRMEQIFASFRPDMVLHAAAYKHVPMMEWNPGEAIKNNVVGTRTIADLADKYHVGEFVMISTDKAVNPTSIMGVSKRVAEIYIQSLSQRSQTRFVAVRFGNVLGSAGSVIPIFKEQIAHGGPVTVTHPDMRRYFMTIPEACQLVLQAATMGRGGEIFILDMGEPVKIVDLARDLIRLSGLGPNDVEIRFTGMRPGEKLFEELALKDEIAQKTHHAKIFIGRIRTCNWEDINQAINELQGLADGAEASKILHKLKSIVPEFGSSELSGQPQCLCVRTDCAHEVVVAVRANGKVNGNGTAGKNGMPHSRNGVKPNAPHSDNAAPNPPLPI